MIGRKAVLAIALVPALLAVPVVARARHLQADESRPEGDTVLEARPFVVDVDLDPWSSTIARRRLVLGTKKRARPLLLDPWTPSEVHKIATPADEVDERDPWWEPTPSVKPQPWKAAPPATDSVDPWNSPKTTPTPTDDADPWSGVDVPTRPRFPATWSTDTSRPTKVDEALIAAIKAAADAGDMELAEKLIKLAMRRNVAPPTR
jgi:hypothetical protein